MPDLFLENRQSRRERQARNAERKQAALDRREAFELEHLEELNEALQDFGRAAAVAHLADSKTGQETGVYANALLSEEINGNLHKAGRAVRMLKGYVLDDQLR